MRLEPRASVRSWQAALAPLLALAAAALLAAVPLALAGAPLLPALGRVVTGALGGPFALGETAARATPLIFTGLAVALAFRARLWNIGAEGQLYLGALAAAALGGGTIDLGPVLTPAVVMAAAAVAGGLWLLGPAWLRLRFGVDEVVTTLLLNFVALLLVSMLLEGRLQDPMSLGWPQSPPVSEAAALPPLFDRLRVHAGLVVALAAAATLALVVRRTVFGFGLRATGHNLEAARHAGVPTGRVLLMTALLSGGLAGLAGASEVIGLKGYLTLDLSPGYGYTGIVVATLAGLSPLGVVPAACFTAAVFVGADSMSRAFDVPSYIANLYVALALLAVLVANLFVRYRVVR